MHLVLASASPRRAELLRQLGLGFDIVPGNIDESVLPGERAEHYVVRLARDKAQQVGHRLQATAETVIVSADTCVVLDEHILGKPTGEANAVAMLVSLGGRAHRVLTGLCVQRGTQCLTHLAATTVWFCPISTAQAKQYWQTGEPRDKAGSYGIQGIGGIFAERIDGSYSCVVGLPLAPLTQLLAEVGMDVWGLRDPQAD